MAQNFIQPGSVAEYQNAGAAIASGAVVKMGTNIGVALKDITATTGTGPVQLDGVWLVEKTTAQAWAQGVELYWDAATSKFTTTVGVNTFAGNAFEPALSADTTGYIRLHT